MGTAGMPRFSGVVVYDILSLLSSILYKTIGHALPGTLIFTYLKPALRSIRATSALGDTGLTFKICLYHPSEELCLGIVVHDLFLCRSGGDCMICGVWLQHLSTSEVSIQ